MNDSRRGFFRLLGAAVAVPPLAVLAKGIATPDCGSTTSVAYREDGYTFYRFHFGPDLKLPEGAVRITA